MRFEENLFVIGLLIHFSFCIAITYLRVIHFLDVISNLCHFIKEILTMIWDHATGSDPSCAQIA